MVICNLYFHVILSTWIFKQNSTYMNCTFSLLHVIKYVLKSNIQQKVKKEGRLSFFGGGLTGLQLTV